MWKKIALVLIFVMVANSALYADDDAGFWALVIGGGVLLGALPLIIFAIAGGFAEAEPKEDNGIKLVSLSEDNYEIKQVVSYSSQPQINAELHPVLNVLSHVDVGITPDKKAYLGVRFQY